LTGAVLVTAADISPELLALLRGATPEQVGDDLVLRLPDGRVFFVDGFFAADESGDGIAPVDGAIALAMDVAALLLGDPDIKTASGADDAEGEAADNGGGNFTAFTGVEGAGALTGDASVGPLAKTGAGTADERDMLRRGRRPDDFDEANAGGGGSGDQGPSIPNFGNFGSGLLGTSHYSGAGGALPIGAISLAAGATSAPAVILPMTLSDVARVEDGYVQSITTPTFTPPPAFSSAGAFAGLVHYTPLAQPLDAAKVEAQLDVIHPFPYSFLDSLPAGPLYNDFRNGLSALAGQRSIWLSLDEVPFSGSVSNAVIANPNALPAGASAESVFAGDDLIFGAQHGYLSTDKNILYGYNGDDILVSFQGTAELSGGAGNDRLFIAQGSSGRLDGGDGLDTLSINVTDGFAPLDLRFYANFTTSIEFLTVGPNVTPDWSSFLTVTPTHYWSIYAGDTGILIFDRATVAAWGGDVTVSASAIGKLRLADAETWTLDGIDSGYARYSATFDGAVIHLSVTTAISQPIQGHITGNGGNDEFSLFGLDFQSFDGGAGDDVVLGGVNKYFHAAYGTMDFSDAATQPFANIEAFSLVEGDHLILSAGSINAMTDDRNAIWVGGYRETPLVPAAGAVTLVDPANWTALGYVTMTGTLSLPASTGIMYRGQDPTTGEEVSLIVSATVAQPATGDASGPDHWFADFDGKILLMPADAATDPAFANYLYSNAHNSYYVDQSYGLDHLDYYLTSNGITGLDVIDLHGASKTTLQLTATGAAEIAGDDHVISVVGDAGDDGVSFFDSGHWQLMGVERGSAGAADFYIYAGADELGQTVTLRVDTALTQAALPVLTTGSDDFLRVTDLLGATIDGQDGTDILQILAAGTLDLTTGAAPLHIEALDLRNGAANNLILDGAAVTNMAGDSPLFIVGEAGDAVTMQGTWQQVGNLQGNQAADPSFILYANAATGAAVAVQDNLAVL
jgi:hypothetical protein